MSGQPAPFAVRYTLGNLISLLSTTFILGPAGHLKQMTAPSRWATALVYVGAIGATLFSALSLHSVTYLRNIHTCTPTHPHTHTHTHTLLLFYIPLLGALTPL